MTDATITAAGMRILKLLVGSPPRSVADLVQAVGVTRTAVAEQLDELEAAGFVERSTEKLSGRGRPRHLYKATQAAMVLLFASNQGLVVPAIWQAIHDIGGERLTRRVLQRVSRTMALHYGAKITAKKPAERLKQFIQLLTDEGAMIETIPEKDGQLTIRKRSCPFIGMAEQRRNVCWIDQDMMSAVVGRPVRQTACRLDGAPCCTFEIG